MSLLADDITLILLDLNSVYNSLKILKSFSNCVGLQINVDKTQVKYIGTQVSYDHFPHGLSWIKTPIQTLGIVITDNDEDNFKHNFQQRILTLKATLNIWKQRKLSLKGKIIVLNNNLELTPIIYVSSVVNTPRKAITEINNVIQNFIWDGSSSKISRKTLIQQIDKGGLKLCHFETKVKALKLSWVKRLVSENESTWKTLPKLFYKCQNLNTYFNANHMLSNDLMPTFYLEIHNLFMKYFKNEPNNLIDTLKQLSNQIKYTIQMEK